MCKIFAMTNMEKVQVNSKFLGIVRDEVCKLSDKDGFGYALLGNDGSLGGERTMRPFAFKPLDVSPEDKITFKVPVVLKSYNRFGKINPREAKSFIAHGRFSTNEKTLENTHPFTNGEVALIHNGVVYDESELLDNLVTTCDSEILLRYWERGGIEQVEQNVSGYYAVAILDKKGQLHIARDDQAMLHIAYCRTVNSYIIATTPDIIKNVAKRMKWKIEIPEEMIENRYVVFDGNEILTHREINPVEGKYQRHLSAKARAAFGGFDHKSFGESDPEADDVPSYKEYKGSLEETWREEGKLNDDAPSEEDEDPRYGWEDGDMVYGRRFGS